MKLNSKLRVTKLEAAKQQIETAIKLWLSDGCPIAIHTLAAAAHQILHDLGKRRGKPTAIRGLPGVLPAQKKQLSRLLNNPENFFKHADNDPGAVLHFNPHSSALLLFDAVNTYKQLTQKTVILFEAFNAWMIVQCPNLLDSNMREDFVKLLDGFGGAQNLSKAALFQACSNILSVAIKNSSFSKARTGET
jgi:hypothetical protein